MASIAPEMSRSIAERASQRGVRMLDAPVTGNPKVAEAGKLGVMIGGDKETVDHVRPLLEKVAAVIVHAGPAGAGSTLKLINNLIMAVAIEAVAEGSSSPAKPGSIPIASGRSPASAARVPLPWRHAGHTWSPAISRPISRPTTCTRTSRRPFAWRTPWERRRPPPRRPWRCSAPPGARQGQPGFRRRLYGH